MNENAWTWDVSTLQRWEEILVQAAEKAGLQSPPIDFRILDYEQMIDFSSYGMTFHYRHWSYGKQYDINRKAKRFEATGLPYETIVNTNPAVAVLWRDNNLPLQIIVIAHCLGHGDFFARNAWFQKLTPRPQDVEDKCRQNARLIAELRADPSIPSQRVEDLLTAAHALMFHRPRSMDYKREKRDEQLTRLVQQWRQKNEPDAWDHLKPKRERYVPQPDWQMVPLEPDEDLLRFLAEYGPLEEWEKQILLIVADESDRLMPNIETRVMNEGWATYWHDRLVRGIDPSLLPPGFAVEYARCMAGVLHPHPGQINPYFLGFHLWQDIYRKFETPDRDDKLEADLPGGQGDEMINRIMTTQCDATWLPSYLSNRLMSYLNLHTYAYRGDHLDKHLWRITDTADNETGCEKIRKKLAQTVGMNSIPVIRVKNANYYGDRTLELEQVHDGRDLKLYRPDAPLNWLRRYGNGELSDIRYVLRHIQTIWRNPINLHANYDATQLMVRCERDGEVSMQPSSL